VNLCHAPDNLDFTRVAKTPGLDARVRVRNEREDTVLELTPAAGVARADIGEVRGGEAFELLQLLNTGHSGTLCTIHAGSAKQGLARFTSCVLESGVELPYLAIKSNIADSLQVVMHIERRPGRRYISEVFEINSYDPDSDLFNYCVIYQRPEAGA
jgi:Flp pilus assembly CpaF family ATPase